MQLLKSEIIPLSFRILGEDFFKKILPLYFSELQNSDLSYLPPFLKKNSQKFELKDYWLELIDYEFSKYYVSQNLLQTHSTSHGEIYLNPFAQILRHEYDIHDFAINYRDGLLPLRQKTLLLISNNKNDLVFLKGDIYHAAIIDELHDGKITEENLFKVLTNKYPDFSSQQWHHKFHELGTYFLIIKQPR